MPWDPAIYNQFKNVRFLPFFDLSDMIHDRLNMKAVDLGCGTGEQTALLVDKFSTAHFVGVDSSSEMLAKAAPLASNRLQFLHTTNESFLEGEEQWDLIFSNAALQWSDNHRVLFPKLIQKLNPDGQFAVQMPYQPENILNGLLFDLAEQEPYKTQLNGWNRPSSVLTLDVYAQIMFDNGLTDLKISQRVYPIIADTHDKLYDFIAGSALIPYLERLNVNEQANFIEAFKTLIREYFTTLPALYAFKRILLYGKR